MDSPPPRPTDNRPSPPRPADIPSPQTNAHLAALLADSYRDADALRRDLGAAQKRAEKADRISEILAHAGDSSSPSSGGAGTPLANGDTPPALTKGATAEQLARVIARYEDRLADAERQRDDSETRRRETVDAVRQLDDFLATLEHYAREARGSFKRSRAGDDAGSGAPFVLPPLASILQAFGPPSAAAHQGRHHARSDSAGGRPTSGLSFPLPPHPHPNPVSTPHAGARRPRTPSMDGMYGAPPSKRPRGDEHRSGREARAAYSESVSLLFRRPFPLFSPLSSVFSSLFCARLSQNLSGYKFVILDIAASGMDSLPPLPSFLLFCLFSFPPCSPPPLLTLDIRTICDCGCFGIRHGSSHPSSRPFYLLHCDTGTCYCYARVRAGVGNARARAGDFSQLVCFPVRHGS